MTAYEDSHYARTVDTAQRYPALDGEVQAEICVIGGGMAGLATTLDLAERGRSVVACEEESHAARSGRDSHREHSGARCCDLLRLAIDEFRDARLHATRFCEGGVGL